MKGNNSRRVSRTTEPSIKDAVRIYLAGPDVFMRNAIELGEKKKGLCRQYGFEGIYPFDIEADVATIPKVEAGLQIGQMNERLIRSCHFVIANMTPFRGPSADVGTSYEMGFAKALGLTVFGYSNIKSPFATRSIAFLGNSVRRESDNRFYDSNDMIVEDWNMLDNLMLQSCIIDSGGSLVTYDAPADKLFTELRGFELCLEKARATFHRSKNDQSSPQPAVRAIQR